MYEAHRRYPRSGAAPCAAASSLASFLCTLRQTRSSSAGFAVE